MHLSSITLKGFKSFPDRTRLTFAPGVSVIVGPNGSGKSNITDAVLWAMGEQSPVAVRGASMQDVIFAGAHGVQARSEAEVEVVLDNASGGLDLPVGEVAITRRLERPLGEGEYRINGARCRLSDVIEILSDTGLGKEMHSVVSQGRVAEIVTSKPRDRRMLIEEAAGLGKHRKRRRRAQLKLERTQDENLDRALDVEREARAAEAAQAPGRGGRVARAHRASDGRGALDAGPRRRACRPRRLVSRRGGRRRRPRRDRRDPVRADRGGAPPRSGRGGALRALIETQTLSSRFYSARSSAERIAMRLDAAQRAAGELAERSARRRSAIERLEAEAEGDTGDDGASERIAALQAELASLAEDYKVRLARELAELEERREAAAALVAERAAASGVAAAPVPRARPRPRRPGGPAASWTRQPRPPAASPPASAPASPRPTQFLRANAGAPGGATALADLLGSRSGYGSLLRRR